MELAQLKRKYQRLQEYDSFSFTLFETSIVVMRLCWFSICFVECIFLFFFRYCIWIKTNKFPLEWGWNALNNRWSRWNHQTNKIRLDLEVGLGQLLPSLLCGSYNWEGNYEDIQKPALCEHLYSLGPSSVLSMIGWIEYDFKASQVLVCVLYRRFGLLLGCDAFTWPLAALACGELHCKQPGPYSSCLHLLRFVYLWNWSSCSTCFTPLICASFISVNHLVTSKCSKTARKKENRAWHYYYLSRY